MYGKRSTNFAGLLELLPLLGDLDLDLELEDDLEIKRDRDLERDLDFGDSDDIVVGETDRELGPRGPIGLR